MFFPCIMDDEDKRALIVKEVLRREKIKLWSPPFNDEETPFPEELIAKVGRESGLSGDEVVLVLSRLRTESLRRLSEKQKFKETGKSQIHVSFPQHKNASQLDLEIDIRETLGCEFKSIVAEKSGLDPDEIKLIACGAILEDESLLSSQKITNGTQVMCIGLVPEKSAEEEELSWREVVEKSRAAALRLTINKPVGSNNALVLEDQHGNEVDIPDADKQKVAVTLALHEKGRSALKQRKFGQALLFFLEADKECSDCNSNLLKAVDNLAILNLDIVWSYLALKNVDALPDAENRLKQCEESFRRVYGGNFERLRRLTDGVELERALIVRMKVLQGILQFHKRNYADSLRLLREAQSEIQAMDVSDVKLAQLAEMGFDVKESRNALRSTRGNVADAIAVIQTLREKETERKQKRKEKRRQDSFRKRTGKTVSGQWLDESSYKSLLEMGFVESLVVTALREADNSVDRALTLLQNAPPMEHLLPVTGDGGQEGSDGAGSGHSRREMEPEIVAMAEKQLEEMGFDLERVRDALEQSGFSIDTALDLLKKWATDHQNAMADEEAVAELRDGVSGNATDHLDVTFEEEKVLLEEYLPLVQIHNNV